MLSELEHQIYLKGAITLFVTGVKSLILIFSPEGRWLRYSSSLHGDCVKWSVKENHSRAVVKCK